MRILDDDQNWIKTFRSGWLAHYHQTGTFNWDIYERPRNHTKISGAGIDLPGSRLMLISSAGAYLADSQPPFDAGHPLGDYTVRVFPPDTPFEKLAYAHEHYDHTAVEADPQVLLPLGHLREMVSAGEIGALTGVVSFMGYQPDVSCLLDETIPAISSIAQAEAADAALLVPA
ncbi:MAG: hypothetical protein JW862_02415 [Anaerolineales bacterium]|nr:hypothetical protein [Anaerolineales bacterium]